MNFIREIFSDVDNKLSAKRVAALLLTSVLSSVVIAHVFCEKSIDDHIYAGLVDVVIWGLAFIGSEKVVEGMSKIPIRMGGGKKLTNPTGNSKNNSDGAYD